MVKRILGLLVAAALIFSCVPARAAAEDSAPIPGQTSGLLAGYTAQLDLAEDEIPDAQELECGYLERLFQLQQTVPYGTAARENLNELNGAFYDLLLPQILDVAANGGSTYFAVSAEDLGIGPISVSGELTANGSFSDEDQAAIWAALPDFDTVVWALLMDIPYELYWFDYTYQCYYAIEDESYDPAAREYTVGTVRLCMYVNSVYRANNGENAWWTVSNCMENATVAMENIQALVSAHADKTDYQKLLAYKEAICQLTQYDYNAVTGNVTVNYETDNSPWQLVYVFDGDDTTNIVCEGYAKAFQYLCEQSFFTDEELYTITVHGNAGEQHAWNIVHLDGGSYLVDLTWCDDETYPEGNMDWFMIPAVRGSVADGYTFADNSVRTYDERMLGLYSTEQLTLSTTAYVEPEPTEPEETQPEETQPEETQPEETQPEETQSETTPMYRLYNEYTLEHLFLTDANERANLISIGWTDENIGWTAATSGQPVYRLYNPYDDFHFYTMDLAEVETLLPLGWQMDGPVSYDAGEEDGVAIYRLFNPYELKNYHHYTTGLDEVEMLVNLGWRLEGVAWYAAKDPDSSTGIGTGTGNGLPIIPI